MSSDKDIEEEMQNCKHPVRRIREVMKERGIKIDLKEEKPFESLMGKVDGLVVRMYRADDVDKKLGVLKDKK